MDTGRSTGQEHRKPNGTAVNAEACQDSFHLPLHPTCLNTFAAGCFSKTLAFYLCCLLTHVCLQVLLRGRVATVRGKGKSCFIVLRQRTATVQVKQHVLAREQLPLPNCLFTIPDCFSGCSRAVPTLSTCCLWMVKCC